MDAKTCLSGPSQKQKIVLLMTDGHPDDPGSTMNAAKDIRAAGTRVITIGVGDQVDKSFLEQMASNPSDFHYCSDSFALHGTFLNVATQLSANSTAHSG